MKILISSSSMDNTGVPTYTMTLYNELIKRGHNVQVYCPEDKPGVNATAVKAFNSFEGIVVPDFILAQANKLAFRMKERFAFDNVPMIFIGHGVLPELEHAPRVSIDKFIAVNEQIESMFLREWVSAGKIAIVRDFIDTDLYKPIEPLQETPRVLFVNNYKKWKTFSRLEAACNHLGFEFRAVGSPYGRSRDMVADMNSADIIVGQGRCILEGMACGRAVISYSQTLGDGYLTPTVYKESRERNFGGYECRYYFGGDTLEKELGKYKVEDGEVNRKLILENHEVRKCVDQIMNIIEKVCLKKS
jgi:hypothetical protein